jgi:hypothetical protein
MERMPVFFAVSAWCLFTAVIATTHFSDDTPTQSVAFSSRTLDQAVETSGKVMTGRSAARSNSPYGSLFIDPSLGAETSSPAAKPTSKDLTAG